jgi:aminopeptidase N
MKFHLLGLTFVTLLLAACGGSKIVTMEEPIIEQRQLDTLFVTAPPITEEEKNYTLPVYNSTATRNVDLLHTKLELAFDWEKELVIGKASLDLTPYFYPISKVELDAKGFETFNSIKLANGTTLEHEYDGKIVTISLPTLYTNKDTFRLLIDYVAKPRADGGSNAITSDKGLFFINPRGEEGDKPQQIWTQGETENNSRWFPTVDKPNERCTQEMYITVQDRYLTLSNGLMLSSNKNDNGTRTDYWKMDLPHAPYLFMLTVGEFAKIEDTPYQGKPVNYYVEKEYAEHAKAIYPHTPAMLGFFSEVTGVEYPWSKYSQIIVRDYVSGAMENTTGVIFGDFMQMTERELIDELTNDKIVAHEMFHHWFGDFVTCESWANLTLNEGFANYSEYLWLEHKYGRDEADSHLLSEWNGYLGSAARGGIHPLIHYGYDDKEDMFDAHSYNKGGSVLHMLRKAIGDDAFFAGLQRYLTDNAYSAVEVDELRMAFEDVTGEDMNWFFDQWYNDQGEPSLTVDYGYDASSGNATVTVKQTQDANKMPAIFQLLTAIDVYLPGQDEPIRHEVVIDQRQQVILLPADVEPALIVFDAERSTLARWEDNKTQEQFAYQLKNGKLFMDRYQALSSLDVDYPDYELLVQEGLQDQFYGIRALALNSLPEVIKPELLQVVAQLATNDPHSEVRATAIGIIAEAAFDGTPTIARQALDARPYNVVAAGLSALYMVEPTAGLQAISKLENETNSGIITTISDIYAISGDPQYLPYFTKNIGNVDGYPALSFFENYALLLAEDKDNSLEKGIEQLKKIGTDMGTSPWSRIASIKTLSEIKEALTEDTDARWVTLIEEAVSSIKAAETNPQLKGIYQQF